MVDATFNEPLMYFVVGFANFNPGGKLWVAGYRKIHTPGSIMAAELNALKPGVSFWPVSSRIPSTLSML